VSQNVSVWGRFRHLARQRGARPARTRREPELREWAGGSDALTLAVLVYDGASTSDIELPARRLSARLGSKVRFVAARSGPHHGVEPSQTVIASAPVSAIAHPELLLVPGGLGWQLLAHDDELMSWLATAAAGAQGVLAVSTGTLVLAATGWLDGTASAGHWLGQDQLAGLGADPVPDGIRLGKQAHLVTASGARAGVEAADLLADTIRWGH